jgi:hypothetical protein
VTEQNGAAQCTQCGRELADAGFCRFYQPTGCAVCCSPACAMQYLRGPAQPAAAPARNAIEEMVEEWRWRWDHAVGRAVTATRDREIANVAEPARRRRATVVTGSTQPEQPPNEDRACAY